MLKFEFIQLDEFDDPEYDVIDELDGEVVGFICFNCYWLFTSINSWGLSSCDLIDIAAKIDELDENTRSQRILGVF